MIGRTERTLKRNIIDPYIRPLVPEEILLERWGDGYIELAGRRIYVVGANDEKAISKIQGMTLAGAYGDEVTTWTPDLLPMLLTRLSVDGSKFFGTMNPDGPFHPVKTNFLDKADDLDAAVFTLTLDDNDFLSDEYKAAVRAEMRAAGPMFFSRYILGLWVAAEGAIYGLDPDGPQVLDEVPDGVQILDGAFCIDYGTTNPTVFLYLGLGSDGRIYVLDEWRHDPDEDYQRKTDVEFSEAFREWRLSMPYWDGVPVVVDPSAASFITQLSRDGVPRIRRANNAVLDGIRVTASLLGSDRLVILRRCRGLIREMSSYVWDPKAAERGEDRPLKKNDHGPDALRYGLLRSRSWWKDWITFTPAEDDQSEE